MVSQPPTPGAEPQPVITNCVVQSELFRLQTRRWFVPIFEGQLSLVGNFLPDTSHQFGGVPVTGIGELVGQLAAQRRELPILRDGLHVPMPHTTGQRPDCGQGSLLQIRTAEAAD